MGFSWLIGAVIGAYGCYSYASKNKRSVQNAEMKAISNYTTEKSMIDLGNFDHYLEHDELCLFKQDDVAWYGYTFNHRDQMYLQTSSSVGGVTLSSISEFSDGEPDYIWNVRAEGTLYLTNKKVILYDKGFSNIWTSLSIEGDYPEQVLGFSLDDILDVKQTVIYNAGLKGIMITTTSEQMILAPSQRKYSGRKTPIVDEYESLQALGIRLLTFKVLVQKLQDNCNQSTNLGHTDTTNLKKVRDWYGTGKCIQMEALSA